MRRQIAAAIATTAAMAFGSAPATAAPIEIGHIPQCLQAIPAAITLPGGPQVRLEASVLLDGVGTTRGQQVFATAEQSYTPLGIDLVPSFQTVSFSGTDAQGLIQQSKAFYGGQRPAGIDVVYTLTSKDITDGGNNAVAGLADCIGGIAFPDRAFAVGENFTNDESTLLGPPVPPLARYLSAKVTAHEIGHLMGGHHHYANCAEGLLSEVGPELSACTLMFNAVDLASLNLSTLNGLVVDGHAEAYALP